MLDSIKIKQKFLLIFSILSILNGHGQTGLVVTELMVQPLNNAVFPNEYIDFIIMAQQLLHLKNTRYRLPTRPLAWALLLGTSTTYPTRSGPFRTLL